MEPTSRRGPFPAASHVPWIKRRTKYLNSRRRYAHLNTNLENNVQSKAHTELPDIAQPSLSAHESPYTLLQFTAILHTPPQIAVNSDATSVCEYAHMYSTNHEIHST